MMNIYSLTKKIRKCIQLVIVFSFISLIMFSPELPFISLSVNDTPQLQSPYSSDVAGSEMYSEQLSAYIAGNASIIKQGYITNDSNILRGFDYSDPAFHECSVLIALSNGITPQIFPNPFSSSAFGSEKFLTYDSFYGFLYYESATGSGKAIADRASRALNIIENLFNIQLFMLDTFSKNRFYPFFGFYPNWDDLFELIINNAPQDGYWGAIDSARLLSKEYMTKSHLSSYILMLDSVNTLSSGFDFPVEFEKFEIDHISTSFADVSEISNIFSSVFDFLNLTSGVFSMFDTSQLLRGDSKIITTILQYEGLEQGIQRISENEYNFDLLRALNYNSSERGSLSPSKKIYISLVGALLSEIDISIYSSDILGFTPLYHNFSSYILDSIEEAAFLLGQNIDISIISDYSLRTFWHTDDDVNRIVTNLYDHATIENPLNLITTLSLTGLPVIPTGILEPLKEFIIRYAINSTEPILRIEKDYRFISYETGEYEIDIKVTNEGDIPAWGRKIELPILNQTFLPIPTVITDFIELQYGMTAEEFLIPEEPPRFIFIDSLGSGVFDYLYPSITNFSQLTFYNPQLAEDILAPSNDDYFNSSGVSQEERQLLAELFNQSSSIFNQDNWKLNPGESITYTLSGLSNEAFFDYSSFYDLNFTITGDNLEPYLSYGQSILPSEPSYARIEDGLTWDILSEQIGQDNLIQIFFSFENTTLIDFYNFSLDQIGLNFEFTSNLELSMDTQFTLEFFNTTDMTFQLIQNSLYSATNTSVEFNTPSNLLDYIDPANNYQSIFKLTFKTELPQILSIDSLIVQFIDRDLDIIMQSPARVAYTTYTGHNTYFIDSNPITAVTDPAPILIATSTLDHYSSAPGILNTYNLTIENVGGLQANQVNVTLKAPGIIADSGNFTLENGYLLYEYPNISVGNSIQNLSFSFYTPNSYNLPLAEVEYNHPITLLNLTDSDFTTYTNDLFISAPIDYLTRYPFLYVLKLYYKSNYTNADTAFGLAPQVGDIIRLDMVIENTGPITLSDFNCSIPNNVIGFKRMDNTTVQFANIQKTINQTFSTELKKTYWDSILFPNIDSFNSSQKFSIQFAQKFPIVLGFKNFEIQKTFSDYDGVQNSIVTVQINVTNTGNLKVYDMTVIDFAGYPKEGFSLVNGTPDKLISSLTPGESFIYTYSLKLNKQGIYEINPASLSYRYITTQTAYSSVFQVKVRNVWVVNALYVILPSLIGGMTVGLIYWSKKRYDLEAAEFSRREELMFGQNLRSVAWNKRTLQEDLLDTEDLKTKGEDTF
ncbi:MAG: hypothetical protein JW776_14095 [Candidatus Lokiarchaeota archaeon]|nr:hypothetical protein [Candidatus Lokiarchaeota archaeon]